MPILKKCSAFWPRTESSSQIWEDFQEESDMEIWRLEKESTTIIMTTLLLNTTFISGSQPTTVVITLVEVTTYQPTTLGSWNRSRTWSTLKESHTNESSSQVQRFEWLQCIIYVDIFLFCIVIALIREVSNRFSKLFILDNYIYLR